VYVHKYVKKSAIKVSDMKIFIYQNNILAERRKTILYAAVIFSSHI